MKKARAALKIFRDPAVRMAWPSGVSMTSFCASGPGQARSAGGHVRPRGSPQGCPTPTRCSAAPGPLPTLPGHMEQATHLNRPANVRKVQALEVAHKLLELGRCGHGHLPTALGQVLSERTKGLYIASRAHARKQNAAGPHGERRRGVTLHGLTPGGGHVLWELPSSRDATVAIQALHSSANSPRAWVKSEGLTSGTRLAGTWCKALRFPEARQG